MKHEWTPSDRYLAAQMQIALGDNPPHTAFQIAPAKAEDDDSICVPPEEHVCDGKAYVLREEYDFAVHMWSISASDAIRLREQRAELRAELDAAKGDAEAARNQRESLRDAMAHSVAKLQQVEGDLNRAERRHEQAERRFRWAAITAGVLGALSMCPIALRWL